MQPVVQALQARLGLPQASQLAHIPASNDRFGASCSGSGAFAPSQSQFRGFGTKRKVGRKVWEPCPSRGVFRVFCMAKERRVQMVSKQIKREISEMLLYDKVVQAAVLPETSLGADMYLTAVATISDVEMSKDLSVAKVYISIFGDEFGQTKALEALKKLSPYVRRGLAKRINLKFTPEVRFIKDESLERGSRVIKLLDDLKRERQLKDGSDPSDDGEEDADGEQQEDPEQEDDGGETEEDKSPRSKSRAEDNDGEDDEPNALD